MSVSYYFWARNRSYKHAGGGLDEASGGLSSISAMSITSAFTSSEPQVRKHIARLTCGQVNSGMQGLVLEAAVSARPSPA